MPKQNDLLNTIRKIAHRMAFAYAAGCKEGNPGVEMQSPEQWAEANWQIFCSDAAKTLDTLLKDEEGGDFDIDRKCSRGECHFHKKEHCAKNGWYGSGRIKELEHKLAEATRLLEEDQTARLVRYAESTSKALLDERERCIEAVRVCAKEVNGKIIAALDLGCQTSVVLRPSYVLDRLEELVETIRSGS